MLAQTSEQALAEHARTIETCLETLLPEHEGMESRLMDAMRYAALGGGKRLRGFLVMEVASLFHVAEACAARVAASVEMLHAYSLVHDDLPAMDNDDLRRGKPSTHRAFDEATAILAGDALQARAFEILAEPDTHSDPQARVELVLGPRCCRRRARHGGRPDDRHGGGRPVELSIGQISRLHALKTGRLIQYAAEAGAILGRATRHPCGRRSRPTGAISAAHSRLPMTCWMPAAPSNNCSARPRARTRPPARRPSSPFSGIERAADPGAGCCPTRRAPI